jgi:ubiquinol-cytochrome c reductase cytochrome b subunit
MGRRSICWNIIHTTGAAGLIHVLETSGGRRGPNLTTVGIHLTRDQLIDQVSNSTPGGGNMPAHAKPLNAAEMTTLVEFLLSLRPLGQPPARSATGS